MNFPSLRLEGSILSADLLDAVAREDKHSQKPADFGLNPSSKVKDEIASTWASAKALWTGYQAKITNLREGQTGASETRNLFIIPLLALLGYQPEKAEAEIINGKSYAISHRDPSRDGFPLHIMGWNDSLEKKRTAGGPRISSHALVQEYLNLTEHLYGLITNGRQLRLLRDSSRLIKLSFLEFDLVRIFQEDLYADFALLFRLLHATRMPANRTHASGSVIEKYHQDSVDSGSRIRDGLAAAVAYSMQTVANGLLAHPDNASLVEQLRQDSARVTELHQNLLRWVYRTLFVLVIEERVLHHDTKATLRQRQLYRDFYSLQRLRRLADRPQLADRRAHDLWRAMHQTLRLYEDGGKGLPLGIAPLGSFLFREEGLKALFQYQLDNRSFLQALHRLSTFTHPDTNVRMRVNYGALDVEEFGSVYESLLELRPRIIPEGEKLTFSYAQLAGNERKTTGSYYTPDSLVQCLLDSALDPVVEDRLKGKSGDEAEKALLSIKVCDPAVGSGHFLIGAAHRLARRLAEVRAGEEALSPDVQRHALRDVISHCLYGVDINPLSVELCKVSLWMLAMEAGKPLSFLDHHIRCGNSLLGATPELIAKGIPDDAFTAIEGDDKKACAALKKLNARERKGFGELFALEDSATSERLQQAAVAVENLPDDSVHAVAQKSAAFEQLQHNYDLQKATDLANLWCAAFVIRKRMADALPSAIGGSAAASEPKAETAAPSVEQTGLFGETFASPVAGQKYPSKATAVSSLAEAVGITSRHLRDFAKGAALPVGLMKEARQLAAQYNFFHWHLAFPEIFKREGFDVVLGNPPWERVNLKEQEWFAERRPDIASAENSAARKKLLEALRVESPMLFQEFQNALRQADGDGHFLRSGGFFPLCGRGDINLYAVFAEAMRNHLNPSGRVGIALPSGIATDDTTKFFFQDLIEKKSLVSLFDFENRNAIFPNVHRSYKFCLLTMGSRVGGISSQAEFVFFALGVDDLNDPARRFTLTAEDIGALNPNSKTCPIFRSSVDANLTKAICRRAPILLPEDGNDSNNAWRIEVGRMFHTSDDSPLFQAIASNTSVRLYEAKCFNQFDHRFATFATSDYRDTTETEKKEGGFAISVRYYIERDRIPEKFARKWSRWYLSFRKITRATDARTLILGITPESGLLDSGNNIYIGSATNASCLLATLNSFAADFVARQKIGGPNMTVGVVSQLPCYPPAVFDSPCVWGSGKISLRDWLLTRVLELTYTAWDLEAFAQDCGWSGPPFRWDEERRFQLRCELDAAFFHLYGLNRDDTAYILDTFPIVKRKDEEKFGTYRTKDRILALYDALAESQRTGKSFVSPLNPPPADARCCHPPKQPIIPVSVERPLPKGKRITLGGQLYPIQLVRALLTESGGSMTWPRLVDAFTLATQPSLMQQHTKSADAARVTAWSKRWNESLLPGSLLTAIETLGAGNLKADRYDDTWMISLRGMVAQSAAEDVTYDAWLALHVLGPASSQNISTLVVEEFGDWTKRMEAQLVA